MGEFKKNNSNFIIGLAAVCLVASSVGSVLYTKASGSQVTNPAVLAVTDPYEFVAALDGEYATGVLNIKVETNAPDGSLFTVMAQHPESELLTGEVTVEKGVASATFQVPEGLSPSYISTMAVMDMGRQPKEGQQLAVKRYGATGEKMKGANIVTMDGAHLAGTSSQGIVPYPSEEVVNEILKEQFPIIIDTMLQMYQGMMVAIEPTDGTSWAGVTITFDKTFVETTWDAFMKDGATPLFETMEELVKTYNLVPKETAVEVTFVDESGTVLATNTK